MQMVELSVEGDDVVQMTARSRNEYDHFYFVLLNIIIKYVNFNSKHHYKFNFVLRMQ